MTHAQLTMGNLTTHVYLASHILITLLVITTRRAEAFVGPHHDSAAPPTRHSLYESSSNAPRLVVLDLDNTVWTPELYQIRRHSSATPVAHRDVTLFPGAVQLFDNIRSGKVFPPNTQFAVASRTKSVDWAHDLLTQFELRDLIHHVEIFPGSKLKHFTNLQRTTGIPYQSMIFFDDSRSGKYGNCEPVASLGVLSVHTPKGLYSYDVFQTAWDRFLEWDGSEGCIVEADGTLTTTTTATTDIRNGDILQGTVKMFQEDKGYGFLRVDGSAGKDVFFHVSNLPNQISSVEQGDRLSFTCEQDPRSGKPRAAQIQLLGESSATGNAETTGGTVRLPCFSMNTPFAALLANGHKTLETRNGTMFVPYPEGTKMLLHVGRRNYPDGDKHIDIMRQAGIGDEDIKQFKSLPKGYEKGMIVAILELGRTYETTLSERSERSIQERVVAYGADSGKIVTEIRKVAYLEKPVKMSGQAGVFSVSIDSSAIPSSWDVSEKTYSETQSSSRVVYSITA